MDKTDVYQETKVLFQKVVEPSLGNLKLEYHPHHHGIRLHTNYYPYQQHCQLYQEKQERERPRSHPILKKKKNKLPRIDQRSHSGSEVIRRKDLTQKNGLQNNTMTRPGNASPVSTSRVKQLPLLPNKSQEVMRPSSPRSSKAFSVCSYKHVGQSRAVQPTLSLSFEDKKVTEQVNRYETEQKFKEHSRHLKRLAEVNTYQHRVDRMYYMSGSPKLLKNRYSVDEEELETLRAFSQARSRIGSGRRSARSRHDLYDTNRMIIDDDNQDADRPLSAMSDGSDAHSPVPPYPSTNASQVDFAKDENLDEELGNGRVTFITSDARGNDENAGSTTDETPQPDDSQMDANNPIEVISKNPEPTQGNHHSSEGHNRPESTLMNSDLGVNTNSCNENSDSIMKFASEEKSESALNGGKQSSLAAENADRKALKNEQTVENTTCDCNAQKKGDVNNNEAEQKANEGDEPNISNTACESAVKDIDPPVDNSFRRTGTSEDPNISQVERDGGVLNDKEILAQMHDSVETPVQLQSKSGEQSSPRHHSVTFAEDIDHRKSSQEHYPMSKVERPNSATSNKSLTFSEENFCKEGNVPSRPSSASPRNVDFHVDMSVKNKDYGSYGSGRRKSTSDRPFSSKSNRSIKSGCYNVDPDNSSPQMERRRSACDRPSSSTSQRSVSISGEAMVLYEKSKIVSKRDQGSPPRKGDRRKSAKNKTVLSKGAAGKTQEIMTMKDKETESAPAPCSDKEDTEEEKSSTIHDTGIKLDRNAKVMNRKEIYDTHFENPALQQYKDLSLVSKETEYGESPRDAMVEDDVRSYTTNDDLIEQMEQDLTTKGAKLIDDIDNVGHLQGSELDRSLLRERDPSVEWDDTVFGKTLNDEEMREREEMKAEKKRQKEDAEEWARRMKEEADQKASSQPQVPYSSKFKLTDVYSFISPRQRAIFQHKFREIDLDKSGTVSLKELINKMSKEVKKNEIKMLHKVFDLNKDKTIDEREFVTVAALNDKLRGQEIESELSPLELKLDNLSAHITVYKEIFEMTDQDGGGHLNMEEIMFIICLSVGVDIGTDKEIVDYIFKTIDADDNGTIDFVEFLSFIPFFLSLHREIVGKPATMEDLNRAVSSIQEALTSKGKKKR